MFTVEGEGWKATHYGPVRRARTREQLIADVRAYQNRRECVLSECARGRCPNPGACGFDALARLVRGSRPGSQEYSNG